MASFFRRPMHQKVPILAGGAFVYLAGVYGAFHAYRIYQLPSPPPDIADPRSQEKFNQAYTALAKTYDSSIGWDEWMMGLYGKRENLLKHAKVGDIIELAAGTGRNMPHYPPKALLKSITFTDENSFMLEQAFLKYSQQHRNDLPATMFSLMDSTHIPRPNESFDTVVDTFGLCSFPDPVSCLKEMKRVCKRDGKILLLEHGRSKWDWLNAALDKTALSHAKEWGCWWNRDIEKMVKDAGLHIVSSKRYHFGTTYEIVASPLPLKK
ncbi:Methyltransferase-like protein 7B [Phlyctochytrium planicorne]|nr:Methyltransferase-like protein 7B [Phlyctochytrium planicorne]